ncbi:MAG: hypothetical protein V1249_04640, partial [Acidimicrobiales bacterium]|nr:hypothetical protein [Acidimicrobiales bacterium]
MWLKWIRAFSTVCVLASVLTLASASPVAAADGDLDTSFGDDFDTDGTPDGFRKMNRTALNDEARSLAFRDDGSVVVGGWDDNNGSLDNAMRMVTISLDADGVGNDGTFTSPDDDREFWSGKTDSAEEVLLLDDGRYAFVGHAGSNGSLSGGNYECVVLLRAADGTKDGSFDGNGRLYVSFDASLNDRCYAGALQDDGMILVGGWVKASTWDLALARVDPSDGSLDAAFGSGGKVVHDIGGKELITAIDVQPDGKILVAGTTAASGTDDFFVARYTSAGVLDTTFSSDGIHVFDLGSSAEDTLGGMDLQPDGRIVVGGYSGGDWAVARLTADGDMDTSFGAAGITTTDFGGTEEASEVVVASDGKILLGGHTNASGDYDMALVRYTSAGVLDTTFSSDGVTTQDFNNASLGSGRTDKARAMGIAANGSVLLAGSTKSGDDTDWAFVQFLSAADPAAFTLSKTTASVTEGGSTDTFTVALDVPPTSDVVLSVASGDTGEATVSPSTLTFTVANWSTPQTVTVTGVDDSVDDGDQDTTVTVSVVAASSADAYDGVANQAVTATTTDDDTSGYTLSTTTASVTEGGSTDTFTVVLNTEPTGTVTFDVSSADTGEATVDLAQLTFGVFNWFTPQTVTITGANDDVDDGNQDTTVTVAVDAGSTADTLYDVIAAQAVTATTVDDDTAGYTLSKTTASVTEAGSTDTFTVVLNTEPTGTVTFDVSSADTG